MQAESYILIILALLNLSISIFLCLKGNKDFKRVNKAFLMWIITISFWYAQQIIETISLSEYILEFLLRFTLLGIWLIPSFFVYFIFCFMNEKISFSKKMLLIVPIIIFVSLILIDFTDVQVVISTTRRNIFSSNTRSIMYKMPSLFLWLFYFLTYCIWGTILLLGHLKRTAVVLYHLKLRYLILQYNFLLASCAILIFIFGLTLDIIIPILKSPIFPISSVTTLFMVIFIFLLLIRLEKNKKDFN